ARAGGSRAESTLCSLMAMQRPSWVLFATLAILLAPVTARGDTPAPPTGEQPRPDAPSPDAPSVDPWTGVDRPLLYSPDPTAPAPAHFIASMSVAYARVDRGAARPFAADIAHAGAVFGAGAEVGVVHHLSLLAEGLLSGQGASDPISAGAVAG